MVVLSGRNFSCCRQEQVAKSVQCAGPELRKCFAPRHLSYLRRLLSSLFISAGESAPVGIVAQVLVGSAPMSGQGCDFAILQQEPDRKTDFRLVPDY
jgi:hypothetical protein